MKRIFGIGVVWLGCSFAWVVLGSTLLVRSDGASRVGSADVHRLWGPPADQTQPTASYDPAAPPQTSASGEPSPGAGQPAATRAPGAAPVDGASGGSGHIPLVGSDVDVALSLEHRRRGLNWYPTYTVALDGEYRFHNPTDAPREVTFRYPLSAQHAIFDGFAVREGERAVPFEIEGEIARWTATLAPGETRAFRVGYRSRGTESWHYRLARGTSRTSDFRLALRTDFAEVDFPDGTLSPTAHETTSDGWRGEWRFDSLIASQPIGVDLPRRVNPGPLAARITFFAPVGMLFFFFVVGILAMARDRDLHPMHYFFFGCAFFAFHLLFAYLVDHLSIAASFAVSALTSVLLVITYARLVVGWRFALTHVGVSQLIYLVLFSLTFLWEGFTGLAISVGAVLTLFVLMQITGKTRWGTARDGTARDRANPPEPAGAPSSASLPAPVLDAEPKRF